MLQAIT